MLPPDARAVLSDALRPPSGTVLDRAVALTFTLDLESALVVPLAFAAHATRDSTEPLAVMEAVRGCADLVDVFCQAGQIAVPSRGSDLLAFLEPMVHPVRMPRSGHLFPTCATRSRPSTPNSPTARATSHSPPTSKDSSPNSTHRPRPPPSPNANESCGSSSRRPHRRREDHHPTPHPHPRTHRQRATTHRQRRHGG
jgi:hypothetical protein